MSETVGAYLLEQAEHPPIPPHATLQQMRDAAKALIASDEDAWQALKTGMRQKAQEFLPGTKQG